MTRLNDFEVLIFDHQHSLVEITASVGPPIAERLARKRRLYTVATHQGGQETRGSTAPSHSWIRNSCHGSMSMPSSVRRARSTCETTI